MHMVLCNGSLKNIGSQNLGDTRETPREGITYESILLKVPKKLSYLLTERWHEFYIESTLFV